MTWSGNAPRAPSSVLGAEPVGPPQRPSYREPALPACGGPRQPRPQTGQSLVSGAPAAATPEARRARRGPHSPGGIATGPTLLCAAAGRGRDEALLTLVRGDREEAGLPPTPVSPNSLICTQDLPSNSSFCSAGKTVLGSPYGTPSRPRGQQTREQPAYADPERQAPTLLRATEFPCVCDSAQTGAPRLPPVALRSSLAVRGHGTQVTSESLMHMSSCQPSSGGDSGRNTQSAPQARALTRARYLSRDSAEFFLFVFVFF